ncbi:MAG: PAS domain S-box protein [Desulforhabdus sp.]|jgi:PAS domain S-box-containing protein|nr:PAS domain S-box protein [Desulforhabdus sp.]
MKAFDYSQKEAAGRTIHELVAPGSLFEKARNFSRIAQRDGRIVQKESERCRKDGSALHVSILGYAYAILHCGQRSAFQFFIPASIDRWQFQLDTRHGGH